MCLLFVSADDAGGPTMVQQNLRTSRSHKKVSSQKSARMQVINKRSDRNGRSDVGTMNSGASIVRGSTRPSGLSGSKKTAQKMEITRGSNTAIHAPVLLDSDDTTTKRRSLLISELLVKRDKDEADDKRTGLGFFDSGHNENVEEVVDEELQACLENGPPQSRRQLNGNEKQGYFYSGSRHGSGRYRGSGRHKNNVLDEIDGTENIDTTSIDTTTTSIDTTTLSVDSVDADLTADTVDATGRFSHSSRSNGHIHIPKSKAKSKFTSKSKYAHKHSHFSASRKRACDKALKRDKGTARLADFIVELDETVDKYFHSADQKVTEQTSHLRWPAQKHQGFQP